MMPNTQHNAAAYLVQGEVMHHRLRPTDHRFTYPVFYLHCNLARLAELQETGLGIDRFRPVALYQRDLGPRDGTSLINWVRGILQETNIAADGEIWLQTFPRVLGYVFNPVSFFYCYNLNGELLAILTEVHSTFGETYCYLLTNHHGLPIDQHTELLASKQMHVSPFCQVKGEYHFRFKTKQTLPTVVIDYHDPAGLLIQTAVYGHAEPLSATNLRRALFRQPLLTLGIVWRIHWQAFCLWRKKVPFYAKPDHPPKAPAFSVNHQQETIIMDKSTTIAGHLDRKIPLTARLFLSLLAGLRVGQIKLSTPQGYQLTFGPSGGLSADLQIKDWRACGKIMRSGDVGFAECLQVDWVRSKDLTTLLRVALQNYHQLHRLLVGNQLMRLFYRLRHRLRSNSRRGSKRNIYAHYDLGNRFYQLWLDASWTYSSAWFNGDYTQDLTRAQQKKYQRIIDELGLKPGDRVLEVGCGWGGFAELAAQQGIYVHGITLSHEQLAFARQRIAQAGLSDHVELELRDYRDIKQQYDAIVSIEMFEAVGEQYWPSYFTMLANCLPQGGKAMLQIITIDERYFERYRSGTDFIQQYIFPGGMLPSIERLQHHTAQAGLTVTDNLLFGLDYAETLKRWHHTFNQQHQQILALGFDHAFIAIWEFYLAYCQAGFIEQRINVGQFLLQKGTALTDAA